MRSVAVLTVVLASCGAPLLPDAPDDTLTLEGPFDGLTGVQASAHAVGDGEFARHFNPATGLGPVFVATSCSACHVADGRGHPVFNITRFGRPGPDGFDAMEAEGGPQLQHRAIAGHVAEALPSVFHRSAQFMAPAVSGLGLLEAVPDSTLIALADPDDRDADGVSGTLSLVAASPFVEAVRAHGQSAAQEQRAQRTLVNGQYIGRFGKKARAVELRRAFLIVIW